MSTETGWEKKIGLADMHGTVAEISYSPAEDDLPPSSSFIVSSGAARIQCLPTPTALRQLAAAALDAADAMEES